MMTYIKLAWRNLWRNRRRTLLTTASISLAIFVALLVRALQTGSVDMIIDNIVQSYTGYIQIHKNGFWENKDDINNTFELKDALVKNLNSDKNISTIIPRLESFALASNKEQTKGVALIGIIQEKENQLTKISKKVVAGKGLSADDNGVLVSQTLAKTLKLTVGDTLVLIGQGFHGVSAAGKYAVTGIVHLPSPDLDNRIIYMNLPVCQEFFSCENRLTSISLNLKNPEKAEEIATQIKNQIDKQQYEVMTWSEMLVELLQMIKSKYVGSYILLSIIYMIISFGIFGTILMMTTERIKEFGVVTAIGMQKSKLAIINVFESIFMGLLGIAMGLAIVTPIIYYYHVNAIRLTGEMAKAMVSYGVDPLLRMAFQPDIYLAHCLIILTIVLLATLYPLRKIAKLNIINAMRSK